MSEVHVRVDDLVAPLFVRQGIDAPRPIASLPGMVQHTLESLLAEVADLVALGVRSVILFGIPTEKDDVGSGAFDPDGIVQRAITAIKLAYGGDLVVIADLCIDEYTTHGHCGILNDSGDVDNDATLEIYSRVAISLGCAGADVVAPSGMMDGQVSAIRAALDAASFDEVAILAYSVKYASALYGPFRDAVDVEIADGGDRRGYQQDHRNVAEAVREIDLDIDEGADMVMIKPAISYLDVITKVADRVDVPVAAYHVSGEYAMIHAAGERGWIDTEAVMHEHLTAIKRAGASIIITYGTRWFAEEVATAGRFSGSVSGSSVKGASV